MAQDKVDVTAASKVDISRTGFTVYKVTGEVKLRHQGVLLFCDQAVHNLTTNRIEGGGHVLLVQGDTLTIKSDTVLYDTQQRLFTLWGHVTFQTRRTIISTNRLQYDLVAGLVHYSNRGRMVDSRNVLTSQSGYYHLPDRQFELMGTARLVNAENTLTAESMIYNTGTRLVTFTEPTRITGKDGLTVARQGQYDTQEALIQPGTTTETLRYASTVGLTEAPARLLEFNLGKSSTPVLAKAVAKASLAGSMSRFKADKQQVTRPSIAQRPVAIPAVSATTTRQTGVATVVVANESIQVAGTAMVEIPAGPAVTNPEPGTRVALTLQKQADKPTIPTDTAVTQHAAVVLTFMSPDARADSAGAGRALGFSAPVADETPVVLTGIRLSSRAGKPVTLQQSVAPMLPPIRPVSVEAVVTSKVVPVVAPVNKPVLVVDVPAAIPAKAVIAIVEAVSSPLSNGLVTKAPVRQTTRRTKQTASVASVADDEISDLERVLNRKKRLN